MKAATNILAIALPASLFAAYLGFQGKGSGEPLYVTGQDVPPAHVVGNLDDTMKRCRKLLKALEKNGWTDGYCENKNPIPYEMLTLPDQKYAEHPHLRESTAFWIPANQPRYEQIAFMTEIYMRQNSAHYRGNRSVSTPSGFLLVAWKDGRIEQVPVHDVRTGEDGRGYIVPGMKGYRDDLPKLHFMRESSLHKVKQ